MISGNLSHSIFSVALAEQELKGYIAEGSEIEDCLVWFVTIKMLPSHCYESWLAGC
jgi:hypothetical protein